MKKTTTAKPLAGMMEKKRKVVAPSDSTLDFIRVFARIYTADTTIKEPFTEICVN